jgi:hypothetical protein
MSLGGPRDGTSRIVQVFRWDDPDLFERNSLRDRASQERRAALKLELERMGADLPERPYAIR